MGLQRTVGCLEFISVTAEDGDEHLPSRSPAPFPPRGPGLDQHLLIWVLILATLCYGGGQRGRRSCPGLHSGPEAEWGLEGPERVGARGEDCLGEVSEADPETGFLSMWLMSVWVSPGAAEAEWGSGTGQGRSSEGVCQVSPPAGHMVQRAGVSVTTHRQALVGGCSPLD